MKKITWRELAGSISSLKTELINSDVTIQEAESKEIFGSMHLEPANNSNEANEYISEGHPILIHDESIKYNPKISWKEFMEQIFLMDQEKMDSKVIIKNPLDGSFYDSWLLEFANEENEAIGILDEGYPILIHKE